MIIHPHRICETSVQREGGGAQSAGHIPPRGGIHHRVVDLCCAIDSAYCGGGGIINRTYGTHKNLPVYIYVVLLTMFGPISISSSELRTMQGSLIRMVPLTSHFSAVPHYNWTHFNTVPHITCLGRGLTLVRLRSPGDLPH